MKTSSLPKSAAAKTTASAAPKTSARRTSKKGAAAATAETTTTTTTNGNGLNGQHDQVIASQDENVSVTSSPQEDQIAARAYQIWLENGQPDGRDEENWHQAQRELAGTATPRL